MQVLNLDPVVPKSVQTTMLPLLILIPFLLTARAQECLSRDYGYGGTVCVCNSDHCDTISRPEKVEQPQFLLYTSNKAGLRFSKTTGRFTTPNSTNTNQVTVNSEEQFQTILGWGGAFTDSTGINIESLDEQTQENLLKSYFSDEGIEYNLCRVPMGGTDFSTHAYSLDDGDVDDHLANFQLAPEDHQYKIPYILRAQNLTGGNLKLFTSTWTAPRWMKTNGEYVAGFLIDSMYQAWADYFVKFLDEYQAQGVEFWGITTGNEPSTAQFPILPINSVAWTPEEMATWITNNLGPTIRNSSHSDINIMMFDDQRLFLPWFVDHVLADDTTRQYIDGVAVHWYFDNAFPPSVLTETHEHFPEKFILATEASNGFQLEAGFVVLGSWDRGEAYAVDIIEDVNNWVGGWVDWNMALDSTGGPTYISNFLDSPIIVNASAGEFYKQPMFYNLGHFSKFVPRGSVRISSTGFDEKIPVAAFQRPDNGTVLVILNRKDEKVPVTISDDVKGTAAIVLDEKSINTILYW